MSVKKDLLDVNEDVRSAMGGFLLENIGGKADAPRYQPEVRSDLGKLNEATGKDHSFLDGDVQGKYVGKIELGGNEFGRIERADGGFSFVEWDPKTTGETNFLVEMNVRD